MKGAVAAFGAGMLFSVGLVVSGMTLPQKVVGFLDFTGAWDPSLALVMVGAIGVYLPAQLSIRRRERPVLAESFSMPRKTEIDARLVGGSALFGVGWGIAGFCPGPALVTVGAGFATAAVFVVAMLAGSALGRVVTGRQAARAEVTAATADG